MGWFHHADERGEHEGFVVGFVELKDPDAPATFQSAVLREVNMYDQGEQLIRMIAAGCDCGWRSRRLTALHPVDWMPSIVLCHASDQERCEKLWQQHVEETLRPANRIAGTSSAS